MIKSDQKSPADEKMSKSGSISLEKSDAPSLDLLNLVSRAVQIFPNAPLRRILNAIFSKAGYIESYFQMIDPTYYILR